MTHRVRIYRALQGENLFPYTTPFVTRMQVDAREALTSVLEALEGTWTEVKPEVVDYEFVSEVRAIAFFTVTDTLGFKVTRLKAEVD